MNDDTRSTPAAEASYQRTRPAKQTPKRGPHDMRRSIPEDTATLTYACPLGCGLQLGTTLDRPKPGLTFVNFTPAALRHLADNHVAGERL